MLSVAEALAQVLDRARQLAPVARPIAESLGLVLAEDVTSDVDSPPHDKSLVDGYAVVAADLASGTAELDVVEEVTAGSVPAQLVAAGCATRIMTGAPIPSGADAVVMIERTEALPGDNLGRVRITSDRAAPGQNIMRRAASMARGQTVLAAGSIVRAIEIGLLAEVGRSEVRVIDRPTVAVLATGNELVSHAQVPAAGQIRNSNGPLLAAAAIAAGAVAVELGIARDEPETLRARIGTALASDVVVISGGVSAGVLDLVPGVLAELGVEQVFHKVNLKPGKPLWFGTSSSSPLTGVGPGSAVWCASSCSCVRQSACWRVEAAWAWKPFPRDSPPTTRFAATGRPTIPLGSQRPKVTGWSNRSAGKALATCARWSKRAR
jgi:molybdopterin molybdotransferase